jgi:hypothetical protein
VIGGFERLLLTVGEAIQRTAGHCSLRDRSVAFVLGEQFRVRAPLLETPHQSADVRIPGCLDDDPTDATGRVGVAELGPGLGDDLEERRSVKTVLQEPLFGGVADDADALGRGVIDGRVTQGLGSGPVNGHVKQPAAGLSSERARHREFAIEPLGVIDEELVTAGEPEFEFGDRVGEQQSSVVESVDSEPDHVAEQLERGLFAPVERVRSGRVNGEYAVNRLAVSQRDCYDRPVVTIDRVRPPRFEARVVDGHDLHLTSVQRSFDCTADRPFLGVDRLYVPRVVAGSRPPDDRIALEHTLADPGEFVQFRAGQTLTDRPLDGFAVSRSDEFARDVEQEPVDAVDRRQLVAPSSENALALGIIGAVSNELLRRPAAHRLVLIRTQDLGQNCLIRHENH